MSLDELAASLRNREPFFVQEYERGPWHVETPDDPETMLCGITIGVDSSAKINRRFGLKPCLWCKKILEDARSSLESTRR